MVNKYNKYFIRCAAVILICLAANVFGSQGYISPTSALTNATVQKFHYIISNNLEPFPTNSGINYIRIVKPSAFSLPSWAVHTNVVVSNYWNNTTLQNLTIVPFSTTWAFTDGQAMATNDGDNIIIYLGNQITNVNNPARDEIYITIDFILTNDFTSAEFTSYIDAVQFDIMPGAKKGMYATTGEQKTIGSAIVSRQLDPAMAYASISPNVIYQNSVYEFNYVIQETEQPNHEQIKYALIEIPTNFNFANFSDFDSILLGTNEAKYIYFTNIPSLSSKTNIFIDYSVIAFAGLDVIKFKYSADFDDPGLDTNDWISWVDGVALDANSKTNQTNDNYVSQTVAVGPPYPYHYWDYQVVRTGNYAPASMTVSNVFALAYFDIIADSEEPSLERLTNLDVVLRGIHPDITGELILYRDNDGDTTSFNLGSETPIVTNALIDPDATNRFYFSDGYQTNDLANPDRYWVALRITNGNPGVFTNNVYVQLTGIMADGTNSGAIFNESKISDPLPANTANVDSMEVRVNYISNNIATYFPRQGTFDNVYLTISLQGVDGDATNFLSYIDVITNGLSTLSNQHIGNIKLYQDTNGSGNFSQAKNIIATALEADCSVRLQPSYPVVLRGTAEQIIFIGYDVSSDETSTGLTFGLTITNGSFGFEDRIPDDYAQIGFSSGYDSGPAAIDETNVMIGSLYGLPWDFKIIYSTNVAPISIGISNWYAMSYFDVIADGEIAFLENITNMNFSLGGANADFVGSVRLYVDSDGNPDTLDPVGDTVINTWTGVTPATALSWTGTEGSLSQDSINPTRYWLAVNITNANKAVFDDTINMRITHMACEGPNGGLIDDFDVLTNTDGKISRVDNYAVFIDSFTLLSNSVPQGSYNNKYFHMTITNYDMDAEYFLSRMYITNLRDADSSDLGYFQVYLDDGVAGFNSILDTLMGAGNMDASGVYDVIFNTPVTVTNYIELWGVFNVDFSAVVDHEVALQFDNVDNDIVFTDEYADNYTLVPDVISPVKLPAGITTNKIIPFTSKPYDFYLQDLNYSDYPEAFTRNEYVAAGYIDLFMDTEDPDGQFLTSVNVEVADALGDISGQLYLYKDTNASGDFSLADEQIAVANVINGANTTITLPAAYSNISYGGSGIDRFFLVYRHTNVLTSSWADTVSFRISDLGCSGPNGGVFANTNALGSTSSAAARVDSYEVDVTAIVNDIAEYFPKQGSFNNPYLKISLSGLDPDATNYLSYIDVMTNGLSTVSNSHIASIKLCLDNGDGVYTNGDDPSKAVSILDVNGATRLEMSFPIELVGSANYNIFIAYDISSDEGSTGFRFGLAVSNNSFGFVDGIDDNFSQQGFATGTVSGPAAVTNVVIASLYDQPWDFKVLKSVNVTPVSIGISNLFAMAYFDIIADGAIPVMEKLTNMQFDLGGNNTDFRGRVILYKESDGNFSVLSNTDTPVATFNVVNPAATLNWSGSEINLSSDSINPTRYWLGVEITNHDTAVFDDSINARVSYMAVVGPNGGVISGYTTLTNTKTHASLIDNYTVFIDAVTLLSNDVTQGSYNNRCIRINLTNFDMDATNYMTRIRLTNRGTAVASDLGYFQIYLDDGDGVFDGSSDTLAGAGQMDAGGAYDISFTSPVKITNYNIIWGVFSVDFSGTVGSTVAFQVLAASSDLDFSDEYLDNYQLLPNVVSTTSIPSGITTNAIIPFDVQPYDFYLETIDYAAYPESFTRNDLVPVGYFDIFMDNEDLNTQFFTSVDVQVNDATGDISGQMYLYRDTNDSGDFSTADELVATGDIINGGNVTINLPASYSNISTDRYDLDRFFLVYRHTNVLASSMSDTVSFQVTGLGCAGPNGGIFTNTWKLSAASTTARVDSYEVDVISVNNEIYAYYPRQGSFNNPYLKVTLAGLDADATNFLSYIDITTNGLSTTSNSHIASLKLCMDTGDGVFTNADDPSQAVSVLDAAGATRLQMSVPIKLIGTNVYDIFITYDVSSDEGSTGFRFGLEVSNNSFGFVDGIDDGFANVGFASGAASGPALTTNVIIASLYDQPWDFKVITSKNVTPVSIGISNMFALAYIDIIADASIPTLERITNMKFTLGGINPDFSGQFLVYKESDGAVSILSNSDTGLFTNDVMDPTLTINWNCDEAYLSDDSINPTRYWLGVRITNHDPAVYTNTINARISYMAAQGVNAGVISGYTLLTNMGTDVSTIDNYTIYAWGQTLLSNDVKQGSYGNLSFKLYLTNYDPDATNFLTSIRLTNRGSADAGDLGFFQVYLDDGDDIQDNNNDTLVGAGEMDASGTYNINFISPVAVSNYNVFWGVFSVDFSAVLNNTVAFQLADASSDLGFSDEYADNYTILPNVVPAAGVPAGLTTNRIIPYDIQPYDYYLETVDYNAFPVSFTSNEYVPVGHVDIFMDKEDLNTQFFTAVDVDISNALGNLSGQVYLYKDTNGSGDFSLADELIAAADVINGGNVTINLPAGYSNVTYNRYDPDRFFLVYRHTNALASSWSDTVSFQISDLDCTGPNGGVFTNTYLLAADRSFTARIDSGEVTVNYISNSFTNIYARQGSFNFDLLKISMTGNDPDGTNYLYSVDIATNGLSQVSVTNNNHIAAIKLYQDTGDGIFSSSDDSMLSVGNFASDGTFRFYTSFPIKVTSSETILFIAFDVASEDGTAVGKRFGLMITNGSFGFSDQINDGFAQHSFTTGSDFGPSEMSNVTISSLVERPWDLKIITYKDMAPISIGVTNLYHMCYFDMISDNGAEVFTNLKIDLGGMQDNIYGQLRLYLDNDGNINTLTHGADTLIASNIIADPDSTLVFNFTEAAISRDSINPNRYWLGLYITNQGSAVFTNTVNLTISELLGTGLDKGVIDYDVNGQATNNPTSYSRVDNYWMYITGENIINNTVPQGSFQNVSFRMEITNFDPDAVYFMDQLQISNLGTAVPSDLGAFQVYRDNNDGSFNSASDSPVGYGEVGSGNLYDLNLIPSIQISGTNVVLWGVFNVGFSATVGNDIALQIVDSAAGISFQDEYVDNYTLIPTVSVSSTLPTAITTNEIIPFTAQPYDFYMVSVGYQQMPQAFTVNENITVGQFELFSDYEQTNLQDFTGVDVRVDTTGDDSDIVGLAFLYKESMNPGSFLTNQDTLIATAAVSGGNDFSFSFIDDDVTIDGGAPDKYYIVYSQTNALAASMDNTFFFQVTGFSGTGPDGGLFTNTFELTNRWSAETRVDSYEVNVISISTNIDDLTPSQASFNHTYLRVTMQNVDADAHNYLQSINVITNDLSDVDLGSGQIPYIKVFNSNDILISSVALPNPMTLVFTPPLEITGSQPVYFDIGYDVSGSPSVVDKKLGLQITNGSFAFVDNIADTGTQLGYVSGAVSGPPIGMKTNVTIRPFNVQPWDLKVVATANLAPQSIEVSNMFSMYSIDLVRDENESPIAQALTNVAVSLGGASPDVRGIISIYRDAANPGTFSILDDDLVANTVITDPTITNYFSMYQSNLNSTDINPSRFWIVLEVTNYTDDLFTNTVSIEIPQILAAGPDSGVITNLEALTNVSSAVSRVDNNRVFMQIDYLLDQYTNILYTPSTTNLVMRIMFSNEDPDGVAWVSNIAVSNRGDAGTAQIGAFSIYQDNGNGTFDIALDEFVMYSGNISANGVHQVKQFGAFPIALTNLTNVLWGVFNVKPTSLTNTTVSFQLPNAGAVGLVDGYGDSYTRNFTLNAAFPNPAAVGTNTIIRPPQNLRPYDFMFNEIKYHEAPHAFSTNQLPMLAWFSLFRDGSAGITERLTNIDILFATETGRSKEDLDGVIYLYREFTNNTVNGFSPAEDTLVTSNLVTGGQDVSLSMDLSNITTTSYPGDIFYIAFELTANIDTAKSNVFSIQIANPMGHGYDIVSNAGGGPAVFYNTGLLALPSPNIRIDSYRVHVRTIETPASLNVFPNSGSRSNWMLTVQLQGDDWDGTNFVDHIDIITNGLSTVISNSIPAVYLYQDDGVQDGLFDTATDKWLYSSPDFQFLRDRMTNFFPASTITLVGTNLYTFFVVYDLEADTNVTVGRTFGLKVTNFGFRDMIADKFPQLSFISGSEEGPAVETNVRIKRPGVFPWDFKITSPVAVLSPYETVAQEETPLFSFNLYREIEGEAPEELIYGIVITNLQPADYFEGSFTVYLTGKDDAYNPTAPSIPLTTSYYNSTSGASFQIDFAAAQGLTTAADDPQKITVAFTASNHASDAELILGVDSLVADGPNNGTVSNDYRFAQHVAGCVAGSNTVYLQSNRVYVQFEDIVPLDGVIVQGETAGMIKLTITALDADAAFNLNHINFMVENAQGGSVGANVGQGLIYLDSTNGIIGAYERNYDTNEIGSGTVDASGRLKALFPVAVPIDQAGIVAYLVFKAEAKAEVNDDVSARLLDFADGFDEIDPNNGNTVPIILVYNMATNLMQSGERNIDPAYVDTDQVKTRNNVFDLTTGECVTISLPPEWAAETFVAKIYTTTGQKVIEMRFESAEIKWCGYDRHGNWVNAGTYVVVIDEGFKDKAQTIPLEEPIKKMVSPVYNKE